MKSIVSIKKGETRNLTTLLTGIFFKKLVREGNGTSLQYSCLENPMDEGAW